MPKSKIDHENTKVRNHEKIHKHRGLFRVFVILCVFGLVSAILRQTQLLCVIPILLNPVHPVKIRVWVFGLSV